MQKPQLFQMFPIILEHWTEVNQGILVHMWLDPVCHLILIMIIIEKLSSITLLSFSLETTWVFKAFRLARYSFLLALAGESAFLGVPLTLQIEMRSFGWNIRQTFKLDLHCFKLQIREEKTHERGIRKRILHANLVKITDCMWRDQFI